MRRLRQGGGLALAIAVASTLLAVACERLGWLGALDDFAYDQALVRFSPRPEKSKDIVLIAIDDSTFQAVARDANLRQALGAWPYTRSVWGQVVQYVEARGARAVVFDAVVDEQDSDVSGDVQMADALSHARIPFFVGFSVNAQSKQFPALPHVDAKNRVGPAAPPPAAALAAEGAVFGQDAEPKPPSPEEVAHALAFPVTANGVTIQTLSDAGAVAHPVWPIPPLLPAVSGFGLVTPEEDPDGKLRRTRFAYADDTNRYVLLPVAAAADLLGAASLELSPGTLTLGARSLRINRDGTARLDYGGPLADRYPAVSLIDVLFDDARRAEGKPLVIPDDVFGGKVVMIGGFALGTWDRKVTPFESSTPGIAKQAALLDSLLFGRFITDAPAWAAVAFTFLVALLAFALIFGLRKIPVELGTPLLLLAVVFCASGLLLAHAHVYLPLVTPMLGLMLSSVSAIAVNHLFADRERERVRQMFSRYLSQQVVSQLVEQEKLPQLEGEDMVVTAFFSDIRGFSTFSEKYKNDAPGLVRILNTYLTRVSAVLLDHGACLDKYIGDAVVCIFGAPLKMEDHAVRACRGALAAQAEVARLREEFAKQGLPDVYTRIGLNSATMFVGNIGSEQLFNYTAIGDGMNLASRLEGANKNYGSGIMIGPLTYELAKDHIEARELDRVRVAGKTEPVTVYELLGMRGDISRSKRELVALYHQALTLYRAARFAEAKEPLAKALALDPEDGPSKALYARCEKLLLHPPPMPFEGVANLEK